MLDEDANLIKVLQNGISALDWSYMANRNHGKLLVDLEIEII